MTFLKQFAELQARTPRIGLQCVDNENSPFCQYTEKSKNCYMTFASGRSEDCLYNTRVYYCTDCTDCAFCHKCELCYECIDCMGCYNASYCFHCENSVNASFCSYCIGVQDCFGCIGLNHKEYHILNKPFSKEAYCKEVARIKEEMKAAGEWGKWFDSTYPEVLTYGI